MLNFHLPGGAGLRVAKSVNAGGKRTSGGGVGCSKTCLKSIKSPPVFEVCFGAKRLFYTYTNKMFDFLPFE